ncbi:MAG: Na/Pi symporter [Thermodesulfobacteriota bacterium]
MMGTNIEFWKLLAGLGIFVYGMFLLEDSVKSLSGRAFKRLISHYTRGRLRAIGSGAFVTAILQSSSAVSLMVLAFVGAGVMSIENGIGIMLGANVGTTFTSWIVAILGFKLKIESFALPVIGIGGVLLIVSNGGSRLFNFSRLLIGFGFIFLGLSYMKESVESFSAGFNLSQLPDYGLWLYLIVGTCLTALMQSSSASMAVILTALNSGLINFEIGVAMVIGANIGTTITVMLGSMGRGMRAKKIVGVSHLAFNLVTGLVAVVTIRWLVALVGVFIDISTDSVTALVLFHTIFNVLGVVIFFPFIGLLGASLMKVYPYRKVILTAYLDRTPVEVPDAAAAALGKEVSHLLEECRLYNLRALEIDEKLVFDHELSFEKHLIGKHSIEDLYENIKRLHAEIFAYYAKLQAQKLEETEVHDLERIIFASRNIMNSIKNIKGIRKDLEEFEISENSYLNKQYKQFRKRLIELYHDMNRIWLLASSEEQYRELLKVFLHIEEVDGRFIRDTMEAVSGKKIQELEIASLLLANRLFTQCCRLQIFGLKDLLLNHEQIKNFDRAMDTKEMIEEEKSKGDRERH